MPNCPNCTAELTEAQVKTIWSAYTQSRIKHHTGGAKATCECGTCAKCKQKLYKRKIRAKPLQPLA